MSRRVLISLAALAALVIVAVGIGVTLRLLGSRGMLAMGLSGLTGREIHVEGPATLRPGLVPALRIEGVTVEPAEGSALHSARIGQLDLVFALWPLVRGDFEVHRLEIDDARVVVVPSAVEADTPAEPSGRYSLKEADVRNLELEIRRGGDAEPTVARLARLSLGRPDEGLGVEVSAAGTVEDFDFDLRGRYARSGPASEASGPPSIEVEGTLAGARVSANGSLDLSPESRSLSLRVRAEAPHLQAFSRLAQLDLPTIGPVHASGLVELRGGTLGVSDLDLQIGSRDTAWLDVTGTVRDVAKQREFSLDASFGFDDVRLLAPLVRDPPHIGRIVGKASVHDRAGPRRIEEFTLEGGQPGIFEIDLEGRFDDIGRVHGLDAQLDLKARDLAVLGELFRRTLPPVGPVEFAGKVMAQEGALSAKHFSARLDRTRLQGSVSGNFGPEQRPRVTAQIDVPELYLDDLGIEPEPDAGTAEASHSAAPGRQLFSDTPLDLAWSQSIDGQLSVRSSRVLGIGGPLLNGLELDARLENGRLSLRHSVVGVDGGSSHGSLELDSRASPPTLALKASARDVVLGRLVEQIDADRPWSGRFDAELDLRSRGVSPRALAAGLEGSVVASCGGGTIATAHAGLLTRDLFQSVRHVLGGSQQAEVLNCLLVDFEFHQGLGTARTLLLDAQDIVIVGEGEIDLGRETLALRLIPRPRRASLLSTAATVRIKGPLTSPEVKTEKHSFLGHTTNAMFHNIESLTGVRRAWGILRGGASDRSPCAKLAGATP
ncbi:MAG: AsmA family protein [Deltaproteobacteria bacterium]|nr:AsmA family protein [Deltaproteobacteria bacterium]MBW2361584.1 AsmA family protein [Deltaproteobacteria bacterium]